MSSIAIVFLLGFASGVADMSLFLHVIGGRPDGYHLLQTLFPLIRVFSTHGLPPSYGASKEHFSLLPTLSRLSSCFMLTSLPPLPATR
jgi:hypothetical protein